MNEVNGICDLLTEVTKKEVTEGAHIALFVDASPHHISPFHRECHAHRDMRSSEIDKKVSEVSNSPPSLSGDIYRLSDMLFDIGVEVVRKQREKKEEPSHTHKRHIKKRKKRREGKEVIAI